jgi:hypothetical protein
VKLALVAFVAAAAFLAGVMVGLGSSQENEVAAPVAIPLLSQATQEDDFGQDRHRLGERLGSKLKQVQHDVTYGEVDDKGGKSDYWEESQDAGDQDYGSSDSGGATGDDNSGPGSDDSGSSNSGPGSGSGSGSSGSGSSGSGSGSSGSGSSGSGSSGSGGDGGGPG